jgi:serine/threonine protein kinase/DNA-binding XRE family transcriptional regulator
MNSEATFGTIVKGRRKYLGLTQAGLARSANCATITVRKIEADAMRASLQIAEHLADALNIPPEEQLAFVRLARVELDPAPIPLPQPLPEEIGQKDLTGRVIKGFELGERLAVGGFGAVYRAVQPQVAREVAIKIILPQYADHPDFIRRFETEAQLVARLEHPYIVPLYDYWREPTVAYLVMRLMRGGSLHTKLNAGPLPLADALRVMQQIGDALHSAHRAGVIHRDIKPANILLDEDGNAYLADFGFARNLGNPNLVEQTQVGTVVGSLAYISPEQIQAAPVNPQSDIYSLGLVFYEMLTGQKPFAGPSPIDYIQQHLTTPAPPLDAPLSSDLREQFAALNPIIGRATAKDAAERYPDVRAMLAEIGETLPPAQCGGALPAVGAGRHR